MKSNKSLAAQEKKDEKGVFYQAGEIIGSIGFHMVDGKDKVISAIKKKLGKKQIPESKAKKVLKKKSGAKTGKKTSAGIRKLAKKANASKAVREKDSKVKKRPAKKDDIPIAE